MDYAKIVEKARQIERQMIPITMTMHPTFWKPGSVDGRPTEYAALKHIYEEEALKWMTTS